MDKENKVAYYLGDFFGEVEAEAGAIQQELYSSEIIMPVMVADVNVFEKGFNVLFFDWGGMIPGSNMLEHLCRRILNDAAEYPSRDYVMTSIFTARGMKEAVYAMGNAATANIFFSIENWIGYEKKRLKKSTTPS